MPPLEPQAGPAAPTVIRLPYRPRKWARAHLHGSKETPVYQRNRVYVVHRRGSKTTSTVQDAVRYATDDALEARRLKALEPSFSESDIKELSRNRAYAHILPYLKQAKLVAWPLLKEAIAGIPHDKNETELSITFPAGHYVRLFGADNPDALRGGRFSGATYDEYQDQSPYLHGTVMSKALADRLGWANFIGTIKGKNQLYQTWKAAKKAPEDWIALWHDIDASLRTEEGATITALRRALEDDRKQVALGLMLDTEFQQEWYLSPEAAIKGAIWGKEMATVRQTNRILRGIYDPLLRVETDWDLGIADHMTIWLSQTTKWGEVRIVGAYSNQGEGLPHYFNWLAEWRQPRAAVWGKHFAPHDIQVRELTTGKSRRETAAAMGFDFEVVQQASLADGINAVRLLLPRCYFDDDATEMAREALMQYRWGWNETLNQFTKEPVHDWASHYADAFRGLAMRHQVPVEKKDDLDEFGMSYTMGADDTAWMG